MNKTIFLFLGPPGSGKGTLSSMCVHQFGWVQLSTGDLCREHIAKGTEIGQQIKATIAQGKLVSDEIIAQMVVEWIEQQKTIPKGILFDGYPRTKKQAELLHHLIQSKLHDFKMVLIKLNIDEKMLVDRILNRLICSNKACAQVYSASVHSEMKSAQYMVCDHCQAPLVHRIDDNQESLIERLKHYYKHEQEIIDFYKNQGMKIQLLQAHKPVTMVFEDFKKIAL